MKILALRCMCCSFVWHIQQYMPRHKRTPVIASVICVTVFRYEERDPSVCERGKRTRTVRMIRTLRTLGYRVEPVMIPEVREEQTLRGMDLLSRHGIKYKLIAVITRKSLRQPEEFYNFF